MNTLGSGPSQSAFALGGADRYPRGPMTDARRILSALLATSLLVVGCTERLVLEEGGSLTPEDDDEPPMDDDGEPPPDDDDDEPPPDDDEPPPDDDDEPPVECVDVVLPNDGIPTGVAGSFFPGTSRFQPSCIDSVSGEVTVSFTAPYDSTFVFDTAGSSFDTVLYALGPNCTAPELACNDDSNGSLAASIALPMRGGESVVLVIDSFGETGEWSLGVSDAGGCPEATLDPIPEVFIDGFLDESDPNSVIPSCAGSGADVTFSWTPPFSGLYRFTTIGSDFDTVLAIFADDCVTELSCNDDAQGDVSSTIDLEVIEGVPITVVVDTFDGGGGSYTLAIFPI